MVDEYEYELPELNEERTSHHPNVDAENVTERVEMTANPAYGIYCDYIESNMFRANVHKYI